MSSYWKEEGKIKKKKRFDIIYFEYSSRFCNESEEEKNHIIGNH